ncbi:MAG: type II toxin-antitoxin system VapC family toxin [Anaerolineae bacterium]
MHLVRDPSASIFLSVASGWEIAIKVGLGKLELTDNLNEFIQDQLTANRIDVLSVQMNHALFVHKLPKHHRDPFDRLLVAQSLIEGVPLITSDPLIRQYPVQTIW